MANRRARCSTDRWPASHPCLDIHLVASRRLRGGVLPWHAGARLLLARAPRLARSLASARVASFSSSASRPHLLSSAENLFTSLVTEQFPHSAAHVPVDRFHDARIPSFFRAISTTLLARKKPQP